MSYEHIPDDATIRSELKPCDSVVFPGYPEWHDKVAGRPILRTGVVSSDPRFAYSRSGNDEGDIIAFEAFSFGGSSGSPVFATQKGFPPGPIIMPGFRRFFLAGVNAGHYEESDTGAHSGISCFVRASAILDIIDL